MLFLNSLLFFVLFFFFHLFWFVFFFVFLFVFFFVLSPRVWSLGASAKKQGEDLADNDGDEDEGISVLEAAHCMTSKATPFARHPLPSPGSPVCVGLPCRAAVWVGGRLAGCAGHPGPSPPWDGAGEKLMGLGLVFFFCFRRSLLLLRLSKGREEAWQLGRRGPLGHLGPFHPEPGHIPPPASSFQSR